MSPKRVPVSYSHSINMCVAERLPAGFPLCGTHAAELALSAAVNKLLLRLELDQAPVAVLVKSWVIELLCFAWLQGKELPWGCRAALTSPGSLAHSLPTWPCCMSSWAC